ncbi:endonuclease III [bacterium F11]|nr:endonuclease III [bacterium F11]
MALLKELKKHYRNANCELNHKNPLQLLVATILSAQCTDQRVNLVTPSLFQKFKSAKNFADVPQASLEEEIRSTGFYRNKAKSIRGMAKALIEKYGGAVPKKMEELLSLPGVARKTANVVLGTAFGIAEGIVVDTHVIRLSQRLGLSQQKDPKKIEQDLMKIIPKEDWIWISHALIQHGRQVCKAQNPDCLHCPVRKKCAHPVR